MHAGCFTTATFFFLRTNRLNSALSVQNCEEKLRMFLRACLREDITRPERGRIKPNKK